MINDETKRKLRELNMGEFISGIEFQQTEPTTMSLPFDERLQRLVDYTYQEKYNARIQRLIKSSKFRFPQADIHRIYYPGRDLNKDLIPELSSCQYIDYHQSIILQGFTGSGKTYLSCALGKQACLNRVKTKYIRIPLLIIDEWLVSDISDAELYFLFELIERRSDTTSTIFCTQYRKDDWVKQLGEGIQAEAIVDRYSHTAFWIETGSMNMREYCSRLKK